MAAPFGIVLEAVSEENYRYWSVLVENYLRGEGLWDGVIEDFPDANNKDSSNANNEDWRRKGAKALDAIQVIEDSTDANNEEWSRKDKKALHAIQLACGSGHLSKITKCKSAKEAWNILQSYFSQGCRADQDEDERAEEEQYGALLDSVERGEAGEGQYKRLVTSVEGGDVKGVRSCILDDPGIISRALSSGKSTVIHLAVMGGNVEIVEALVNEVPPKVLEMEDEDGYTALALVAAFTDNESMAGFLIDQHWDLLVKKASKGTHEGLFPLVMAADMAHKQLTAYLYKKTRPEILEEDNHKYAALLFHKCINSEIFDVALDLIETRYASRDLPLNYNGSDGMGPLHALAKMPFAFPSGSQFSFWQRWIYNSAPLSYLASLEISGAPLCLLQHLLLRCCPAIEGVYQQRVLHDQVTAILSCMCQRISQLSRSELRKISAYDAMLQAAKNGIFEFIELMSSAKPEILWESKDQIGRGIFAHAILHRRREVFELFNIHKLGGRKKKITCSRDRFGNNLLHLAAMLGPSLDLDQRSGAALQMQRELLWFKAVESNVGPKCKRDTNDEGKTAQEVFAQSHKVLIKEAESWAKDAANSFIIMGTLIITIIFAAAFTLPGGNDEKTGKPKFLKDGLFTVFIVADAVALCAASSSVLIFIGVLASRYAEEDFLIRLPSKLLSGLFTLSVSVVSMLVAFCAAFFMVLQGYPIVSWISMVLAVVTVLFFLLPSQYRLFSQIFGSYMEFKPIRPQKKKLWHRR